MRCSSCDIELSDGRVVVVDGRTYCCSGCAAGGPCVCTYEDEHLRLSRTGRGWRVMVGELLDRYEWSEFS